jgi:aerotolerance regulator-like protein
MIWLVPTAWVGLAALVVPFVVHLLAHRRAEPLPFPTLRFVRATRLAAIRRRALTDVSLLALRVAMLAVAVAAAAGPLLVTSARREAWNARVVRAVIAPPSAPVDAGDAFRTQRFETADSGDGIRRAVAWLANTPPARREIVVAGPLTIGSIDDDDMAAVPPDIGVRFERTGALPAERKVDAPSIVNERELRHRQLSLTVEGTTVEDTAGGPAPTFPIEIIASPHARAAIEAAVKAVLSQQVWTPPPGRSVRLLVADDPETFKSADVAPIRTAWMANVVARTSVERSLQAQAARRATGIRSGRLTGSPWIPLARAADGRAIAVAASSSTSQARMLVAMPASLADDLATPLLVRTLANAASFPPDPVGSEVVPIPDAQLRAWTRPPPPMTAPRPETVESDDRRWFWLAVIAMLAFETWVRRTGAGDAGDDRVEEAARVA